MVSLHEHDHGRAVARPERWEEGWGSFCVGQARRCLLRCLNFPCLLRPSKSESNQLDVYTLGRAEIATAVESGPAEKIIIADGIEESSFGPTSLTHYLVTVVLAFLKV